MANVLVQDTSLTAIADAIRAKNGESTLYKPSDMAAAITAISSGGNITSEDLTFTGQLTYGFAHDVWNGFIAKFGDLITTQNISDGNSIFNNCLGLEEIPFDLNFSGRPGFNSLESCFYGCQNLKTLPKINNVGFTGVNSLFANCYDLKAIPEDIADTWIFGENSYTWGGNMFRQCLSLRKSPDGLLQKLNDGITANVTSKYSQLYYYGFQLCTNLDSLKLPVIKTSDISSNMFQSTFSQCSRLKGLEFYLDNGQPFVRNWKQQTIDLTTNVGHCGSGENYILDYNSGITSEKKVADPESYAALKNDPDWYASDKAYSRYNHDSAVATINSLPDTSAYLASAGGTNTIKFTGDAGSATDGGAINTLTEEEIAVAAAKGWTVSLV